MAVIRAKISEAVEWILDHDGGSKLLAASLSKKPSVEIEVAGRRFRLRRAGRPPRKKWTPRRPSMTLVLLSLYAAFVTGSLLLILSGWSIIPT